MGYLKYSLNVRSFLGIESGKKNFRKNSYRPALSVADAPLLFKRQQNALFTAKWTEPIAEKNYYPQLFYFL